MLKSVSSDDVHLIGKTISITLSDASLEIALMQLIITGLIATINLVLSQEDSNFFFFTTFTAWNNS